MCINSLINIKLKYVHACDDDSMRIIVDYIDCVIASKFMYLTLRKFCK